MLREDSFEGALEPPASDGNGVAIFTRSGGAAQEFAQRVDVGMVGINVPIQTPWPITVLAAGNDGLRRHEPTWHGRRALLYANQDRDALARR